MTDVQKREADPTRMSERSFSDVVFEILEEKRLEDVVWLDVRDLTSLADDFIIATVLNPRQAAAVKVACEQERKRRGLTRLGMSDDADSGWVVLDYGDLVVHLLTAEKREYYALDDLWADAKRVS